MKNEDKYRYLVVNQYGIGGEVGEIVSRHKYYKTADKAVKSDVANTMCIITADDYKLKYNGCYLIYGKNIIL